MNIEELVKLVTKESPVTVDQVTELTASDGLNQAATVLNVIQSAEPEVDKYWIESLDKLGAQIDALRLTQEKQASVIGDNTRALVENLASRIGEGLTGGLSSSLGSLGGGSILSPWIGALAGLFRGGQGDSDPGPSVFERPAPLNVVRDVSPGVASTLEGTRSPLTVNVNVQALDSRSIVDRSDEIAGALRRALLESRSVRDVLEEV